MRAPQSRGRIYTSLPFPLCFGRSRYLQSLFFQVETIGPVYMIACGCPVPAADHASRLATLALEIRDYGASLFVNDEPVHLKMGIHSGSVSLFLFCASLDSQRKKNVLDGFFHF